MIMKSAIAALLALGALTGTANARTLFDDIRDSAPRSVFDDIRDSAPRSIFDDIRDSAPRSVFDDIRDSAPRSDIFIKIQRNAP
jgi:hypothetical protein